MRLTFLLVVVLSLGCATTPSRDVDPPADLPVRAPPEAPRAQLGQSCQTVPDCIEGLTCELDGVGRRRCAPPADAGIEPSPPGAVSGACRSDWDCTWDRQCMDTPGDARCLTDEEFQARLRPTRGGPRPTGGGGCPHRTQVSRCAQPWTSDGTCTSWTCGPDSRPPRELPRR